MLIVFLTRNPHRTMKRSCRFNSWILLVTLTLLAILAGSNYLSALEVPPLRGRVNDVAGLLPPERERALEERLAAFERETGHQIAVLTISSLEGEDLEGFSIKVAETWKIGKKGFDNGAILLIARNDRKLRIEVGYGLEGVLPDAIASRIIREVIVPRFRANDYPGGIEAGVDAILKVTRGERLPPPKQTRQPDDGAGLTLGAGLLLIAALFALIVGITQATPLRGAFAGGATSGVAVALAGAFGSGLGLWIAILLVGAIVGVLANLYAREAWGRTWSARGSRRDRWVSDVLSGGGGFGGGGFGGGGGFSGGGGGFGGGGASGSW